MTWKRRSLIMCLPLLLVLAGCGGNNGDTDQPPVATGASYFSADEGRALLHVEGRDPDGGMVTFRWTAEDGPAPVAFTDSEAGSSQVRFFRAGTYQLAVRVSDAGGQSVVHRMAVDVPADEPFTIEGHIEDGASNAGIPAALVWKPLATEVAEVTSSADGTFAFSGLLGRPDDFSVIVRGLPVSSSSP